MTLTRGDKSVAVTITRAVETWGQWMVDGLEKVIDLRLAIEMVNNGTAQVELLEDRLMRIKAAISRGRDEGE